MKKLEFNEAFMGAGEPLKGSSFPGFGMGNRVPSTSRVEKRRVKAKAPVKPVTKGLARAAVVVVRQSPREFAVLVKGTRELVGFVRQVNGAGGKAYGYQVPGEKAHNGFPSQKAAVARMLEKS